MFKNIYRKKWRLRLISDAPQHFPQTPKLLIVFRYELSCPLPVFDVPGSLFEIRRIQTRPLSCTFDWPTGGKENLTPKRVALCSCNFYHKHEIACRRKGGKCLFFGENRSPPAAKFETMRTDSPPPPHPFFWPVQNFGTRAPKVHVRAAPFLKVLIAFH